MNNDLQVQMYGVTQGFPIIDFSKATNEQIVNFLTPFLQEAGYKWQLEGNILQIYKSYETKEST